MDWQEHLEDLWHQIFCNLSYRDMIRARLVSKRWSRLSSHALEKTLADNGYPSPGFVVVKRQFAQHGSEALQVWYAQATDQGVSFLHRISSPPSDSGDYYSCISGHLTLSLTLMRWLVTSLITGKTVLDLEPECNDRTAPLLYDFCSVGIDTDCYEIMGGVSTHSASTTRISIHTYKSTNNTWSIHSFELSDPGYEIQPVKNGEYVNGCYYWIGGGLDEYQCISYNPRHRNDHGWSVFDLPCNDNGRLSSVNGRVCFTVDRERRPITIWELVGDGDGDGWAVVIKIENRGDLVPEFDHRLWCRDSGSSVLNEKGIVLAHVKDRLVVYDIHHGKNAVGIVKLPFPFRGPIEEGKIVLVSIYPYYRHSSILALD